MDTTIKARRRIALDFLSSHRIATLATIDKDNKPDAATIYYLVDKDFILYFLTRIESRKYYNLQLKSLVSMVVSDENTMETIQLRGTAERIEDFGEEGEALEKLWRAGLKDPSWPGPAVKLYETRNSTELAAVKVKPQHMTYAKFDGEEMLGNKSFFQKII